MVGRIREEGAVSKKGRSIYKSTEVRERLMTHFGGLNI